MAEQSPQEGFRDEFNTIDPMRWVIATYATPFTQYRTEHVEIRDGILVCKVPAGLNEGGQLDSVKRWHYGRYRCRMRASNVPNTTTAFYSYYKHPVTGLEHEIDIEIDGGNPRLIDLVLWKDGEHDLVRLDLGFDASKDFHVYGYDWTEDKVVFWVDDKVVLEYTNKKYIPVEEQYCLVTCYSPSWKGLPPDPAEGHFDWVEVALPLAPPFPWWLVLLFVILIIVVFIIIMYVLRRRGVI